MKKPIKYVHKNTGTWMFIAALCVVVPNWRQLKYPQVGEWVNTVVYPFSGTLLSNEKERTTDAGHNMYAHYCAEWKKPVKREYRRCDYIKFQKMKLNLQWQNADWKLVKRKEWMQEWITERHKETSGSARSVCCLGCGVHTCQNG